MANEVLFWHGEKIKALASGRKLTQDNVTGSRAAVDTLTSDTVQPANGDTVTIKGLVYTFQTALTNVARNVLIAGTAALTLTNLFHAINATGGVSGTDYAAATVAHPDVVATNPTATSVVITAKVQGAAGNAIAVSETSAHLSWATATLTTGQDADVITSKLYGFPHADTFSLVTLAGGNTNYSLPIGDEGQEITLYLKTKGGASNAVVAGAFVGGTALTFSAAGQFAKLKFMNASWAPIANTGTIA